MLDKALYIMLFMWIATFGLLGIQWMMGDIMGQELTIRCSDSVLMDCDSIYGEPMKPYLLSWSSEASINTVTDRASEGNYSGVDKFVSFAITAAYVAWDLISLVSGVYVFTMLYFIGIPSIMVIGIGIVYLILLLRAIFGWIRGV